MVTLTPPPRALPRLSLRLKVTLCMSAVALIIQTLLGALVLYIQHTSVDELFSSRLVARAEYLATQIRGVGHEVKDEELALLVRQTPRTDAFNRVAAVLFSASGQVVASTERPAPAFELTRGGAGSVFRRSVAGVFAGEKGRVRARLVARPYKPDGGPDQTILVVAEDTGFDAASASLLRVFAIASGVGIIAWGVAAWLIAGLAMAPLRDLRLVAGSFSPEAIERDGDLGLSSSNEVATLEHDLRESRSRLRSALHAQDRFISNVSHELNTPIAVLLTEAQTLRAHELSPEAKAFAQSVTEEMQRLGRMVGSFLTLTKLRGGQGLSAVSPCPVNDVVMDTIQQCGSVAGQHNVMIVPLLPEDGLQPVVCGDTQLLRAMLDNLLRNAIRYSPRGGQVLVRVAPHDGACEIGIRDAGPGVPDNLLGSLFDRFADVPRHVPSRRGHGLGLSIAQGVAELHGGRISVRNMPEGGCEFTVRLPLASQPEPADPCPA